MKTYKEHYEYCRKVNPVMGNDYYKNVYDLTVDNNLFDDYIDENYYDLIENIRKKIDDKIKLREGCFIDDTGHAIRVNDWRDIKELYTLTEYFMPVVERDIFGCSAKIEFLHPYRNVPNPISWHSWPFEKVDESDPKAVQSSWKWHYDDCPSEFVKLFIHLNEVTYNNGCLKYIEDKNGNVPVLPSYRIAPHMDSAKPHEYVSSRVPPEVVGKKLDDGGQVVDVIGKPGSYAIHTPNIIHRASCPKPGTEPRDVLFFFIRPTIKKYSSYLSDTYSYKPERNVKMYELD